ncbi:MAG: hypothetical protein FGM20_08045 [Burkholderiaceae bacterium]|nr:hypothetical protein [Burkholderiaceae bacterium]
MRFATDAARREYAEWLDGFAVWEIILTLTFTQIKSTGDQRSVSDTDSTKRLFIRLINHACFGHGAITTEHDIANAYVIKRGRVCNFEADLDEWLNAQDRLPSTTQAKCREA